MLHLQGSKKKVVWKCKKIILSQKRMAEYKLDKKN